jgi:hypothetical protein
MRVSAVPLDAAGNVVYPSPMGGGAIDNAELLRKAVTTTADFGGAGEAPLSIQQADRFIVLLSTDQVMLNEVRRVSSNAAKWNESILDFSSRIARPGVEATRLDAADRTKPATGMVEISTTLLRAEVPVSDEVMEDIAARANFREDLTQVIGSRFGFDVEDLMLNGDVGSADPFLALFDGWLVQAGTAGAGAGNTSTHVYDATADGQDYQAIFRTLLLMLPDRFKRGLETDFRYYVPKRLEEKWRDILSSRGTALGDIMLTGRNELRYQGILIKGVPSMGITTGTPDKSSILLTHRMNLYAGFRRDFTFESFRDPREGATSFIVTARVDSKVAIRDAMAVAQNVDVEPN